MWLRAELKVQNADWTVLSAGGTCLCAEDETWKSECATPTLSLSCVSSPSIFLSFGEQLQEQQQQQQRVSYCTALTPNNLYPQKHVSDLQANCCEESMRPSSRKAFNKNIIHEDCFGTNSIKPPGYSWPTLAHSSVCAVANPVSFPPASTHLAVHSAGWRGPLVPPTYWWSCLGC